jgi:hypothetical protein
MTQIKQDSKTNWQYLEKASNSLEKEVQFFDTLYQDEEGVRIVNRIVMMLPVFDLALSAIQDYLVNKQKILFKYKPDTVAAVLYTLLQEMVRHIRLCAYLSIRGVFPQFISTARNALELIGVFTHIWNEPNKVDFVFDDDSNQYARAFRYTKDVAINKQLKNQQKYRFYHCKNIEQFSHAYKILNSYVHVGLVGAVTFSTERSEDLSCYFVDRLPPDKLTKEYQIVQEVLALIAYEIFMCIPKSDFMHEDVAAFSIAMT